MINFINITNIIKYEFFFFFSNDDARPKRNEPMTVFLGGKGFTENTGSMNPVDRKPTIFASYVGAVTVSIS